LSYDTALKENMVVNAKLAQEKEYLDRWEVELEKITGDEIHHNWMG